MARSTCVQFCVWAYRVGVWMQMNAERIVCLQAWLLIMALHLSTA